MRLIELLVDFALSLFWYASFPVLCSYAKFCVCVCVVLSSKETMDGQMTQVAVSDGGVEPADTLAARATKDVSALSQLVVCMKKNFWQKKRMPMSCCLEMLLPVLFVAGLVGAWAATSNSSYPSAMFVSENEQLYDHTSSTLQLLCTKNRSIPTIPFCNVSKPLYCFPSGLLPVEGLCTPDRTTAASFMQTTAFGFYSARSIPTFDEMVRLRWLGRGMFGNFEPRGARYLQPDCGFAHGIKLYGVLSDPVKAFFGFLNRSTQLFPFVFGGFFETEQKALDYVVSLDGEGMAWALVSGNSLTNGSFAFTIRMNRSAIIWTHIVLDEWSSGLGDKYYRLYWSTGFLTLATSIQNFVLQNNSQNYSEALPTIGFTPMPYIPYKESEFLLVAGELSPLVLVLAYLYSVSQLVKRIVEEKELRIREGMMIMGLHKSIFYFSWLLTYAIQQITSSVIIAVILKLTMLKQTDVTLVFVVFLLFSFSTVTFAALIASFLSKSRLAATLSPIAYFLTSMPLFMINPNSPSANKQNYMGVSVFSPSAFALGTRLLFRYERRRGMGWSDIFSSTDKVNMAVAFAFLLGDLVAYFLFSVYFDAVLPSEWGTRAHPLFCFLFWRKPQPQLPLGERELSAPNTLVEVERSASPTVLLKGLRKVFDGDAGEKIAVDDVSLMLYPDEVNVLLGHNGAGKTTIINMLTGMLPSSGGDAEIYGKSILRDMGDIRKDTGMCPQHNILFNNLTVREHLEFFAGLKGMSSSEREEAATSMMHETGLDEFAKVFSENLSGGNKRKLSVAIAFIGRSRLIFLDEPTAGMDVGARRHTWDIIRRMTKGRTIVLAP